MNRVRIDWRGEQAVAAVLAQVVDPALVEFGLRCENKAKQSLTKGHGVLTGTLRRSIHIASPGYNWGGDNCTPDTGSPDLGGQQVTVGGEGSARAIELGSGMEYAMAVHQGHDGFGGYHYLVDAVDGESPRLPSIIQKYAGGLK